MSLSFVVCTSLFADSALVDRGRGGLGLVDFHFLLHGWGRGSSGLSFAETRATELEQSHGDSQRNGQEEEEANGAQDGELVGFHQIDVTMESLSQVDGTLQRKIDCQRLADGWQDG